MLLPAYKIVFDKTNVSRGTRLLDVGCGPGLAAQLAAKLGASVTGLDASEAELIIARERVPDGDFRQGEMEEFRTQMPRLMWSPGLTRSNTRLIQSMPSGRPDGW